MDGQKFKLIFDRLKKHMNAVSDADIARGLNISPQALFTFKKREKFPSELLINYCLTHQLSLDWLLSGEGPVAKSAGEISKVAEEGAAFVINIKDYIAGHNRAVIENMLGQIERIINEGDYRKTSALQSFLEVLDPQGEKKSSGL